MAKQDILDIIEDAQQFVNDVMTEAESFADKISLSDTTNLRTPTFSGATQVIAATTISDVDAPPDPFDGEYVETWTFPTLAELQEIYTPDRTNLLFGDAPEPLDTSDLFQYQKPVFDVGVFDREPPPVDTEVELPIRPDVNTDVELPELIDRSIGDAPNPDVVTYQSNPQHAVDLPPEPTDPRAAFRSDYSSALTEMQQFISGIARDWITTYVPRYFDLMDALAARIEDGLQGGVALPDEVEERIYTRARDRVEAENSRELMKLRDRTIGMGHDLPPGMLAGAERENAANTARRNAMHATEIAIERAKIELQHMQFVMGQANTVLESARNGATQFAGVMVQVNGQAIQYAERLGRLYVEYYNLLVARANLQREIILLDIEEYDARLKSSLAELEVFRIRAEGTKLAVEVDELRLRRVDTQLRAELLKLEVYGKDIEAALGKLRIAEAQLGVFREEINAYTAFVGAKQAEFQTYVAALNGDRELVRAWVSEWDGYRAQLAAQGELTRIEALRSEVDIKRNDQLIRQFEAELREVEAQIRAEGVRFESDAERYKYVLERWKLLKDDELERRKVKVEEDRIEMDGQIAKYQGEASIYAEEGRLKVLVDEQRAKLHGDMAQAFAAVAEGAASSLNSMVSLTSEDSE